MKLANRLVSLLLAAGMTVSFVPVSAFAVDTGGGMLPHDVSVLADNAVGLTIREAFPDEHFREYVISNFLSGREADSVLTEDDLARLASVPEISCSGSSISSLEGIQYFSSLTKLSCSNNNLTAIDLSHNEALTNLDCGSNKLTVLDVRNNIALKNLHCADNTLTAIDLSHNEALTDLACFDNKLVVLDVSNNPALKTLSCYRNSLTALNVSNNTALTHLYCHNNQLSDLDVSNCTALSYLDCRTNQLTELDCSRNAELASLDCHKNQLTGLDCSNNKKLDFLDCHENQLKELNVRNCTSLAYLDCSSNQLTSLDLSGCPINYAESENNSRTICVSADGTFALSTLPGFDVTKANTWTDGDGNSITVSEDGVLTLGENVTTVTYAYYYGSSFGGDFTLNVHRHTYDNTTWTSDATSHWHECTDPACPDKEGSVTGKAAHTYDENGKCTECGYQHEHILTDWKHDETSHWKECSDPACPDKEGSVTGKAAHTYDENGKCTVCDYQHEHTLTDWKHDETSHWKECTADGCFIADRIVGKAEHTYDSDTDDTCNVCGFKRTLPEPEPEPKPEPKPEEPVKGSITLPEDGGVTVTDKDGNKVTAAAKGDELYLNYDLSQLPEDKLFDGWTVTDKDGNAIEVTKDTDGKYHFTMPEGDVKIELRTASVNVDPETPAGPTIEEKVSAGAGGVIAGAAMGAAGYVAGTQIYLTAVLPKGTPIPTSRGALAALLWTTAGKPEPATAALYADVSEADTQKAARWCDEQGLLADKGESFKPDAYVTRVQVIRSWNALQKLLK